MNSTRKFEYPGNTIEPTDRLGAAALTTDMDLKLYDYFSTTRCPCEERHGMQELFL